MSYKRMSGQNLHRHRDTFTVQWICCSISSYLAKAELGKGEPTTRSGDARCLQFSPEKEDLVKCFVRGTGLDTRVFVAKNIRLPGKSLFETFSHLTKSAEEDGLSVYPSDESKNQQNSPDPGY